MSSATSVPTRQLIPTPAPQALYSSQWQANYNRVVDQNFSQVMAYLAYAPVAGCKVANLPSPVNFPYLRGVALDSTLAATGNFGAGVVGGGANIVPVWNNGTAWYIG